MFDEYDDDDRDDSQWTPKPEDEAKKERAKRQREAYKDGKLTDAGRAQIKNWADSELVFDDTARLSVIDLLRGFENSPDYGFSLNWNQDEFFPPVYEACDDEYDGPREKDSYGHYPSLHARFRDELDFSRFYPDAAITAVEYLVEGVLPLRGVNMFVSLPETMKTWAALDIAVCVSQGKPWLGKHKTKRSRVAVVNFEMDPEELKRRLALLGADRRVEYVSFPRYDLNDPKFWAELKKLQPGLVIIDSLSAGSGSDVGELDSRFAGPLRRASRFVAEHAEQRYAGREYCSFLFIHHSPKGASLKDSESLFRGTGAIRGGVDTAFYFEKMDGDAARITSVKARKGMPAATFAVRLHDERGLELLDARKPKAVAREDSPADRFFAFVEKNPGTSASHAAKKLRMRKEDVLAARQELGDRLRVEGKASATKLFATGNSVPDSVPTIVLGTERGNQSE